MQLRFDEALPTDFEGDTKDRLKGFLESVVGNDTPVSAILKCINQGIVAPAIMALRIGLMGKINYKDCGNHWDIEVRIGPSTACVIHQKVRFIHSHSFEGTLQPTITDLNADIA